MAKEFLGPRSTAKVLEGVLEALPLVRPNFMQQSLASGFILRNSRTVNFDKEFQINNIKAEFVHPKADGTPIELGDFDHTEVAFAYSKEFWGDDDFDVLDQRQMGDQFGQVNIAANQASRLVQKATIAEQRFENLFEDLWCNMALYGAYQASGEKHPTMKYNFNRVVAKKGTDFALDLIPSANLTTSTVTAPWGDTIMPVIPTGGGFTSGQKAWTKANVDAGTATPVEDLKKMYETSVRHGGNPTGFVMQASAYAIFNYDVEKNYADAAVSTISSLISISRDIVPQAKNVDGLTRKRNWSFEEGTSLPIYTYDAKYNDRTTGTEVRFVPDGWVICLTSPSNGLKVYGRIQHKRAGYIAMPRFINRWVDPKTEDEEFEMHTSFLLAHKRIDSLVAWKVN